VKLIKYNQINNPTLRFFFCFLKNVCVALSGFLFKSLIQKKEEEKGTYGDHFNSALGYSGHHDGTICPTIFVDSSSAYCG